MKKIFLVYGHYDDQSFNAAIRDTFIKTAEEKGNKVDTVDLYKEKFDPVFAGEKAGEDVLNHRKRIEECDWKFKTKKSNYILYIRISKVGNHNILFKLAD